MTSGNQCSLYMYGIVRESSRRSFETEGIEGSNVFSIPERDVAAVTHKCGDEPYQSKEDSVVKGWVKKHQEVLDKLINEYGDLLPSRFNTIFHSTDERSAEEVVRQWLADNYQSVSDQLDDLAGKKEYGVIIYYNKSLAAEEIAEESSEVAEMEERIEEMSSGRAYMYKQKLSKLRRQKLSEWLDSREQEFLAEISNVVSEVQAEDLRSKDEDFPVMLKLSCLLDSECEDVLGEVLEEINEESKFNVRFTGPWPPFSFADLGGANGR
ncbi:GvpL/GvpF family gas vesicle protein [Candidatus Bipolaricaulota bacterium]|nr:GvpL/GvpF family gas vesicle protein [Candidatus Bipolaricaulota bacterium]